MVLGTLIGASMIAPAIIYPLLDSPTKRFKQKLYYTFSSYDMPDIKILEVYKTDYGFKANIQLPHGLPHSDFMKELEGIEQSMMAKIRVKRGVGRILLLDFGMLSLDKKIDYERVPKQGMKIPLATPFGFIHMDFTHMVGGGATDMGKTVLQLLIATHLYIQSKGTIDLIISSNKTADYYMFKNLPNVTLVESDETLKQLKRVVKEYEKRKEIINELGNVNDHKTLREKYPDKAFQPIYVIIDECGVFSEDKDVKEQLTEIAERARYVDIHLVLFSQRPDVKVLNERIKANLLTRIALTTASDKDSRIILGMDGAEKLGGIKGRAILLESLPVEVQIPYLSNDTAERLLRSVNHDRQGRIDHPKTEAVSSPEPGPDWFDSMFGSSETVGNREPDHETVKSGWALLADPPTQRQTVSLHAEPRIHTHAKQPDTTLPGISRHLPIVREA
jgi:hypothetical protein